ncbi:MAG TPA: proton-conducting transporter membrane subunit [Cyclobacteriaceae bacterium]|nr:proton-conducting transporter membrane subunit [Cyclobacteriaceae bacterium]
MIIAYIVISFLIGVALFVNRNRIINYSLVSLFSVLQWVFILYLYHHRGQDATGYFNADSLAILMLITSGIIIPPAFYYSYIYFKIKKDQPRERGMYFSAMVVLAAAISAAYLANHIALMWVFVELTTLSAAALVYHRRNVRSLEGTWKYFFVSSISITLVFIGILFLTIALQQEGFTDLTYPALKKNASSLNGFWLRLTFIFIFTGYTAKMGLVPMHTVGIDAKDKAPSPAGALFSSIVMNMGFVGIFRVYEIISRTPLKEWADTILLVSAVLSIFVAAVYMMSVKNMKRMFAYSSIEHMGIAMLGIAAGGIGYYAALLHLVLHAITKSSLFFQMGQVYRIYNSKSLYDTGNYLKYNLTGAMVILLAFICGTAMPPSGLFVTEFMIFRSLFESHHFIFLAVILLLLTMIIWAFGKSIFRLLFTPAAGFNEAGMGKINPFESVPQLILLGAVIYLGINPPVQLVELINESVKYISY